MAVTCIEPGENCWKMAEVASWEQSRGPNWRGSNSTESGQLLFIVRRGGREKERGRERERARDR